MSLAIFSPTPYFNKWQMSLCNNSSDNKSYWIHRVDVKVSAQVTTVTYMHQSQPSLHSLRKHLTVHLKLWPGNHLIWCNATYNENKYFSKSVQLVIFMTVIILYIPVLFNSFIETTVSAVQPHILYTPWSKNVIQISVQMQCVIFEKQN